jgi:nucleoside-diphosphate-sugar epimerase
MKKYTFIIGGTGFLGEAVLDQLPESIIPIILTRKENPVLVEKYPRAVFIRGDASKLSSIKSELNQYQIESFVYMIGLIREYPNKGITFEDAQYNWAVEALEMAEELGVSSFTYVSANGVEFNSTTYQQTKLRFEEKLKSSVLNYHIVRPSIIWGESEKYSFQKVINQLTTLPLIIIPGSGNYKLAPVSREIVADSIVENLHINVNRLSHLCGAETTLRQMIISNAKKKWGFYIPIFVPIFLIKFMAGIFDRFRWFPISRDQIIMLEQGNVCSSN